MKAPKPLFKRIRFLRWLWIGRIWIKHRINSYAAEQRPIKIVIGSGKDYDDSSGWIYTDLPHFDATSQKDWNYFFKNKKVSNILAEHVLEHLTSHEVKIVLKLARSFMTKDGTFRIAVPDAFNNDPSYIDKADPSGLIGSVHGHQSYWNYQNLGQLAESLGWTVKLLEYHNEKGEIITNNFDFANGNIFRCSKGIMSGEYVSLLMELWNESDDMSFMKPEVELQPAMAVVRVKPCNLKEKDEAFFQHEYRKEFPPAILYNLKDVNVSFDGIVFKKFKVFDSSLIHPTHHSQFGLKYILGRYLLDKRITLHNEKNILIAFDIWSDGYYHWMLEVLPKIFLIHGQLKNFTLLFPDKYKSPFYLETLKLLGVDNYIRIEKGTRINAKRLTNIKLIAPSGNFNPEVMQNLGAHLVSLAHGLNAKKINPSRNLYISRKKSRWRYVLNEDRVIEKLAFYGFESICMEDYSMVEQIIIMNRAQNVITMHGAGIANALFMQKGTSLMELRKRDDGLNNSYYSFINAMELNYFYQFCDFEDTKAGNYFNIDVDIQELTRNVELMLNINSNTP